jgi:hypothetical protein
VFLVSADRDLGDGSPTSAKIEEGRAPVPTIVGNFESETGGNHFNQHQSGTPPGPLPLYSEK